MLCYFWIFVLPTVLDKLRCCNSGINVNEPFTVLVYFNINDLETVMIEITLKNNILGTILLKWLISVFFPMK